MQEHDQKKIAGDEICLYLSPFSMSQQLPNARNPRTIEPLSLE
jgi:hypothetical protein